MPEEFEKGQREARALFFSLVVVSFPLKHNKSNYFLIFTAYDFTLAGLSRSSWQPNWSLCV